MLTLNAGKMYGPKQVGLLWVKSSVKLVPLIVGGGQERGIRSGTENVAGTIGFARAAELAKASRKGEAERLGTLRDSMEAGLTKAFPNAIVSGRPKKRLPSALHISFEGLDAERLLFRLEAKNVLVATGSACAANKETRSHVLEALALPDAAINGSLRITLGKLTDEKACERALELMIEEITLEYDRIGSHA